jgi:hypothetical protein
VYTKIYTERLRRQIPPLSIKITISFKILVFTKYALSIKATFLGKNRLTKYAVLCFILSNRLNGVPAAVADCP